MTKPFGLVHVTSVHGHRASYSELAVDCFGLAPSVGRIGWSKWRELVAAPRLFFATIDDDLRGVIAVCMARMVMGRRTAGLFLRPKPCFQPGWRYTFKRLLFKALRRVPGLSLFTIIPFDLFPAFRQIAAGWVHDPQLWDMAGSTAVPTLLSDEIANRAAGRKVLTFLGVISDKKGFPFFSQIAAALEDRSHALLMVAAGKVTEGCAPDAPRFEENGGMLVDRYLSDAELLSLFGVSDMVWSCYDPGYDQASGAFGRSLQFGRVAVTRRGSIIERYAELASASVILLDFGDAPGAVEKLCQNLTSDAGSLPEVALGDWRKDFVRKIEAAMDGVPNNCMRNLGMTR